ncbi:hypothetical protein RhiJN_08729 [Ceratobasidium sp. AG-Ba]|nr:hypothetical protein RhiJN_08729 [Ceratobasidium sp. AG-Ba]
MSAQQQQSKKTCAGAQMPVCQYAGMQLHPNADIPSSCHVSPSRARTPSDNQGRGRSPSPDNQPSPREPSPGDGSWPYSRDASQEPLLDPPENTNDAAHPSSPDSQAETPEAVPINEANPYSYPYSQTPTSHTVRNNEKGVHIRGVRNGTKTAIEKLGDRLSKFEYTRRRVHPFAIEKKISYFNPYSAIRASPDCYDIITKPKALVGGPGRGDVPLHVAAGLQMDKDFYHSLRNIVKHALASKRPKKLAPGTKVNWSNISAAARRDVYKIVKETSKTKADMFADHRKYVDDYSANARTNRSTRTANNDRPTSSRASTTDTRHGNRPHDRAVNHPRLQDADSPRGRSDLPRASVPTHAAADPSHTLSISNARRIPPANLPPTPTARQVRKADKRVAQGETQRETAESRSAKATSGTKGKQRAEPPRETTPPIRTDEESEEEEENIRMFTTKVKVGPRQHARVISPGPEAQANAKSKSAPKSQLKSSKFLAKIPPPANRKSAQESNNEEEDPIPNKHGKSETATGSKRKVEEARDESQQTEQPSQKRARPTPIIRPVPSETVASPPPPPSDNPTGNSSNAMKPNASRNVPILISPSNPPNVEPNEEHDTTASYSAGLRVVKKTTKMIARPVKAVAPSDRLLRKRG